MRRPATRLEDLVVWPEAHPFVLAACCLSRTFPGLKLMACRLNFGARPSALPRTLRKGSRHAGKQTNSAFTTWHKVP